MLLNYNNFDDEAAKLEVLEARATVLQKVLSVVNDEYPDSCELVVPDIMKALAMATFALALAQIETNYWQHPHLACRLRTWVTAILQEGSHQLTDDSMIFYAIRNGLPAEQLESLMEKLE